MIGQIKPYGRQFGFGREIRHLAVIQELHRGVPEIGPIPEQLKRAGMLTAMHNDRAGVGIIGQDTEQVLDGRIGVPVSLDEQDRSIIPY